MIDNEKNDKNFDSDYNSDEDINVNQLQESTETVIKSSQTLTSDELTAQGILFFIAGYDTTSASLSHAIYYLSQYRDCQQKLYEELAAMDDDFTYENLNGLKYLNAVINETLRMAPPLSSIQRECIQDYKLGDTGAD